MARRKMTKAAQVADFHGHRKDCLRTFAEQDTRERGKSNKDSRINPRMGITSREKEKFAGGGEGGPPEEEGLYGRLHSRKGSSKSWLKSVKERSKRGRKRTAKTRPHDFFLGAKHGKFGSSVTLLPTLFEEGKGGSKCAALSLGVSGKKKPGGEFLMGALC